ncbi:hypothetical protein CBR_g34336 [Chara braunii]|uniref:Ubiquitin-like protease family profile domain-containing protein n=1 Tax=Chara braunii TaxID=69332 RepID=A0A388LIF0_CHABU|nr:hypothetical protein CBR_g34336 [Chara braunii]|eukprot:GBG82057.1 hypothetical protein CBR_g34336 [Chara braunii]
MMRNVWSAHYVNGMFSFRHLDRETTTNEKEAVTCRSRDARIFDPPLDNPVELTLAEGMVFSGEKRITYVHVRGKEATFDGICMDVWDHVAMRKDVVAASNIAAHVIQEGQLYQHVGRDMYGYHVNWVPGSLHPAVVDGKVTLAAKMQSDATLLAYLPVLQHRPRDKGWGLQSTAFRKRKAVILHKALSTVLRSAKEASHDGMIVTTERFGEITIHPFVMNYVQDYPERCALATVKFGVCPTCTVSKDDFDVIADFSNCRRSQTLETQLAANCFNNGDNDIRRAAEARMSELNMHKHVEENGLWGFYRGPNGDDPQLDYHLALQPDRMHTIEHDIFLHMIDAFKATAYKKLPDIAQTEMSESYKMNERVDGKGCIMGSKATESSETTRNDEQSCGPSVNEPLLPLSSERSVKRWKRILEDPWYAEMYQMMTTDDFQYPQMAHEPLFSIAGGNRSRGMVVEAGKRSERVDKEHLFPFTWTSRRHVIAITKRDVLRLGAKQWLNDNVIDLYLQFVYEEHFPAQDNTTFHVCTTFWHPAVIANQKVYVSKAGWQERIKSRPAKLHRLSNELRTTTVVLIPVNHKNHWKLLLLLNVGRFLAVTEDNDGQSSWIPFNRAADRNERHCAHFCGMNTSTRQTKQGC